MIRTQFVLLRRNHTTVIYIEANIASGNSNPRNISLTYIATVRYVHDIFKKKYIIYQLLPKYIKIRKSFITFIQTYNNLLSLHLYKIYERRKENTFCNFEFHVIF